MTAPTPTPGAVLDAESVKRVFGLDPDQTGNRNRGWRIVDDGESNDLRYYNGTDIPAGSLAVHTRDGGSNPLCAEACRLPNFIGTVEDDYDRTYRDYFYAPLDRLARPTPEGEKQPDARAICEALGFDPTNHHNAAACPYCIPDEKLRAAIKAGLVPPAQPEPGELEVVGYRVRSGQSQLGLYYERETALEFAGSPDEITALTDLTQAQAKIARLEREVADWKGEWEAACSERIKDREKSQEIINDRDKWIGDLTREKEAAEAELAAVSAALGGGARFMDPPDGGSPTLAEQVRRMHDALKDAEADAAKVREPTMFWDAEDWENGGPDPADVVGNYAPGEVVKMDTAIQGPTRWGVMNDQHEVQVCQTADEAEAWFAAQTEREA